MPADTRGPVSRWSLACGWLAVAVLVATLLLLAYVGPAYRAGWLDLGTAIFGLLRWVVIGSVASMILGLVAVIWNHRRGTRRMLGAALIVLVAGLGLSAQFGYWLMTARSVPPIHDITTDTENPPQFVDIVALRADAPNPPDYAGPETAEQQRAAYPDLQPIRLPESPDRVFAAALTVVESLGWALVAQVPDEGRIEATDTTRYFGFADDVVIRIRRAGDVTVVDVRSKSRIGMSDLGTNARRIQAFRDGLLEHL